MQDLAEVERFQTHRTSQAVQFCGMLCVQACSILETRHDRLEPVMILRSNLSMLRPWCDSRLCVRRSTKHFSIVSKAHIDTQRISKLIAAALRQGLERRHPTLEKGRSTLYLRQCCIFESLIGHHDNVLPVPLESYCSVYHDKGL